MIPLHRRTEVVGLALLLALAGCGRGADVGPPPEVDTSGLDEELIKLFQSGIDAIEKDPGNPELRARLGMAYEVNAITGAARTAYEQAVQLDPDTARWLYLLACIRSDSGELDEALLDMDRVIELDGSYAPAHWRKGDWLLELGRLDEAEDAYRESVRLEPDAIAPRVGMARIYIQRDQNVKAVQVLQAVVNVLPDHAYLHQLLGTAYRQMGRMEDARAEMALASQPRRPSWPDPWRDEKNRYKTGFAAEFQQAMAMLGRGRHDQAIPILEQLRTEEPNNVALLSNLGAAYVDTRRMEEAMSTLNAALAIDPDYFSTHLNLSSAYEQSGDIESALRHVDHAIRSNPTLGAAYQKKGLLLARIKRYEEAIDALATARRYDARTATSLVWSGWVRSDMRQWSLAIEDFETAIEQEPNNSWAHLGLARAAAEAGEMDKAERALQRATELNPDHPQLPGVRRRIDAIRRR